ncbi:MAG: ABC transporter permease subunit [Anaerolineaceae bacterium]|nr:ABC transporter permease subunit [Anaerolineaceae bacterium]
MAETNPKTDAHFAKKTLGGLSSMATIILMLFVDIGLGWFIYKLLSLGYIPLSVVFIIILLFLNYVFLAPRAKPLRWMAVGISALILFSIFPIFYTVYNAVTNYGDKHFITKTQAIAQIEMQKYLPKEGKTYTWIAYQSADKSHYLLFLKDQEGNTQLVSQTEGQDAGKALEIAVGKNGIGELDADGSPKTVEGFTKMNKLLAASDKTLPSIKFGPSDRTIQISSPNTAAELLPKYKYDAAANTFMDQETGEVYKDVAGTYSAPGGKELIPGYIANIGLENFKKFVSSPGLRGPLVTIIIWNFVFAFFSVFLTFSLGLAISILYGDPSFKGKKLLRTFLLIPYTIPSLITILIWRGMFNPQLGIINRVIESVFGVARGPDWFNNATLARIAILVVNLWLGYPYFMLVTSGALQSIPGDIYEAAQVDGASPWRRFFKITLPLLLVSVGPLLIASFIFNFNNFNLIYAFVGGGPPIPSATTQAGYTDILISYVYNLAFGSRGINYGYASAISIFVFAIVAVMSLLQFRFTNMWEEVGENV